MQILVNADSHEYADEQLLARVKDAVALALHRYGFHINRAEVQLSQAPVCADGPPERRCRIEVRLRGCQPLSVEYAARTIEMAIDGALYRVGRVIDGAVEGSVGQTARGSSGRPDTTGLGAAT